MIGPLPYIGGKNRLAAKIISLLPEHTAYVEPFAGGAQVFFHKAPSKVEVLNDLNGEIVNFFRVCQWHHGELVRYLHYCLMGRRLFELLTAANPETLTDVQRAGRFFYLQKNSFGGLVVKQNYHYTAAHRAFAASDSFFLPAGVSFRLLVAGPADDGGKHGCPARRRAVLHLVLNIRDFLINPIALACQTFERELQQISYH